MKNYINNFNLHIGDYIVTKLPPFAVMDEFGKEFIEESSGRIIRIVDGGVYIDEYEDVFIPKWMIMSKRIYVQNKYSTKFGEYIWILNPNFSNSKYDEEHNNQLFHLEIFKKLIEEKKELNKNIDYLKNNYI